MQLSELLSPMAGTRMMISLSTDPPSPDNPESFGRAALDISENRTDRWRLAVLLMSFEGLMSPTSAATICVAMGEQPTLDTTREALTDIDEGLTQKVMAALRVVAEADQ